MPGLEEFLPGRLVPLLAALESWGDVLRDRLATLYTTLPAVVSSTERPALAASLAERRRALEVEEEALVLTAAAQGIQLARRPDADPVVVLTTILGAPA